MAELKALLFDVDGTLADTERNGHRVAFNRAFLDAGLDWVWSEDFYGELLAVTGGKERILYYLERFNKHFRPPRELSVFITDLHRAKTEHFKTLISSGAIPLRSGVRRLITEAMAQRVRLGIATTTTADNVLALLTSTLGEESLSWFEVIAAGDLVPEKKPAPDIYRWTIAALGLTADECLAIEDSENGLRSALSAGIGSVLITVNSYTEKEDFNGASLVVSHLGEKDSPPSVIKGEAAPTTYVDMSLLRRLHRHSSEPITA